MNQLELAILNAEIESYKCTLRRLGEPETAKEYLEVMKYQGWLRMAEKRLPNTLN